MAGSGQCDGRHANRRGFPGLAPPRCHPGPPSLSLSESSSPARECAQGRGARDEVARPARAPILPPPPPAAAAGRALPKGRGEVSGGAAAVTEAARRAQRSAQGGGRQWPRVNTQRVAPAGGAGAGGLRSLPTGRQGWEPAGDRVRSLGSGESGSRGSSPAPPPASPRPAKPPPRRPHTSL